jgi:hypothetical protein
MAFKGDDVRVRQMCVHIFTPLRYAHLMLRRRPFFVNVSVDKYCERMRILWIWTGGRQARFSRASVAVQVYNHASKHGWDFQGQFSTISADFRGSFTIR